MTADAGPGLDEEGRLRHIRVYTVLHLRKKALLLKEFGLLHGMSIVDLGP
jgi:hypothetical protein